MYIVTFYSFKGGVGRSMAMANVAAEMAKSGLRVLMVDFDLEAPGIDTFKLTSSTEKMPGIVEYVTRYIETGEVPDIKEYIYELPFKQYTNKGQLWIIPAGLSDCNYGIKLNSIDWQKLYAEQEGYLLFEDIKEQWKLFGFDYVLIDSRTGFTDIGGICTRQLPDATVILFLPTKQHLLGLEKVVSDIRKEKEPPQNKHIDIHFVLSNVPALDDEEQILENKRKEFQEVLKYDESLTIYHYNSLSLLDQIIFTLDHPQSRLAKEYHELSNVIRRKNTEDREKILDVLKEEYVISLVVGDKSFIKEKFDTIKERYSQDGEILYYLGTLQEQDDNEEEAIALYSKAIEKGYNEPEVYFKRFRLIKKTIPDFQEYLEDIKKALFSEKTEFPFLRKVSSFLSKPSLSGTGILEKLLDCPEFALWDEGKKQKFLYWMRLELIGARKFSMAMQSISSEKQVLRNIDDIFNYAMAEWAETGSTPRHLFRQVVELDQKEKANSSANYSSANYAQCLAIACWAIGEIEKANNWQKKARQRIQKIDVPEFSAWRYQHISRDEFLKDLDAIQEMIDGKVIFPIFMASQEAL